MISDGRIGPKVTSGDGKFGKRDRLIKTKDFRSVYEKGRKAVSRGAAIMILDNGLDHNRLGFSISKKNFKLAVTRNRIRRLFKEIYRKNKKELPGGFDIVLIIKRGFDKHSGLKETEMLFLELFKKQELINDKNNAGVGN